METKGKFTKEFRQNVPPLLDYLKNILGVYHEGPQVLQEQVQNADDAGATEIKFLYDKSHYPTDKMWSESLRDFNGPSLFVYNDAIFEEQDFENIQNPQRSGKRDDRTKIGRFGMGFISVYHLTDVPSVLSRDQIGFLDPHAKHFIDDIHTDPSKHATYPGRPGLSFYLNLDTYDKFIDQVRPYINPEFNCSQDNFVKGEFEGTIFRFPLRNAKHESQLCSTQWDDDKVIRLFESFKADAQISPLFLKSIQTISFYQKNSAEKDATLLFRVTASESPGPDGDHLTLQTKRKAFMEAADNLTSTSMACSINITITDEQGERSDTSSYLSVNTMKMDEVSPELQELINDIELNLLPWVGVCMHTHNSIEDTAGRSFCFLPLPDNQTILSGLPIHVHGYFGLTNDRQRIEWPEVGKVVKAAEWNQCLVDEVFPEAYVQLIQELIKTAVRDRGTAKAVYAAWPMVSALRDNWEIGVRKFLQYIKERHTLFSSVNGTQSWLKPSDVYIEDNQDELVQRVMEQKGYPVPAGEIPGHVMEALKWADIQTQSITPELVVSQIRGDPLQGLNRAEKMKLLEYILNDGILQDLENIHLLPLSDGSFTYFSGASAPTVYISTSQIPRDIFPHMASRFAADDLPEILKDGQYNTQLKLLTHGDVPSVLAVALPREWMQCQDVIINWIPGGTAGAQQQPDLIWLETFWNWMVSQLGQTSNMLTEFIDFPLVPLDNPDRNGNIGLARLKRNTLIYRRVTSSSITESVGRYLESLGVVVIQGDLPGYITQHPYIDRIILQPDANGVAHALEAWWSQLAINNVAKCSNGLRDDLRHLFTQGTPPSKFKDLLSKLPIFRSSDGAYVAVSQCKRMVPAGFYDIPVENLTRRYLLEMDDCGKLAIDLGAVRIIKSTFIKAILKDISAQNFYTSGESQDIMGWMLQYQEYDELIRNISFVPTTSGLKRPTELFLPDNEHLRHLFKYQAVFPASDFAQEPLLYLLKRLLRRESSVTPEEILEIAVRLPESHDVEVATALLTHITEHPHLLDMKVSRKRIEKELGIFLQDHCWVPCEAVKPDSYPASLQWKGSYNQLHFPEEVALHKHANLLGSVKPLNTVTRVTEQFSRYFGWRDVLSADNFNNVNDVVKHMQNVVNGNHEEMSRIVEDIYGFLNQAPERHLENSKIVRATESLVWHGSGFTTADKAAFNKSNMSVDLAPYLYVIPTALHQFKKLYRVLGVQEQFGNNALNDVLQCIQEKHACSNRKIDEPQKENDLLLVCDILRSIVAFASPDAHIPDVLVPCRELQGTNTIGLKMVKASECMYVDVADEERLLQVYNQDECNKSIIHEMVPNAIAKRLGLDPMSHQVAPLEAIDLGYEIEGPHQSIVNCIKRNLEMYKEGLDIFKELIQNADDAGATEVKFLIDWRENQNSRSKLLNDGMGMCHGPALWVYNNATFTDEDVTNICSVAAASKKEDLEKIGRFGLGFTSVYHITDVPSFVSGPFFMIFDPRTNHLGDRVNPGRPGVKLNITKESHRATLRTYQNQFQPYQGIFGCDLSPSTQGYDKTLFRLPLRTETEARNTTHDYLSEAIYNSKEQLEHMVKKLKESASTLLLFTQNVTHVKVQTLKAECTPADEYETLLDIGVTCEKTLPERCIGNQHDPETQRQILRKTAERLMNDTLPVPESTYVLKVTEKFPKAKRTSKDTFFVVSSCMAKGSALKMACSLEGRKAGILPCGGVAVQLEPSTGIGGHMPVSLNNVHFNQHLGSAFTYLPLSVSTRLPFHINGNFLLQPNRCQLWSKSSSASGTKKDWEFETRWNVFLMEEVLTKALINLLEDLQILQHEDFLDARQFQTLWPLSDVVLSDIKPVVEAFYKQLVDGDKPPKVIYNGNKWVGIHDCFFVEDSLIKQDVHEAVLAILNGKLAPEKKWVQLDATVMKSMLEVDDQNIIQQNTYDLSRFLKEVFFPAMKNGHGNIQAKHSQKIILHLLDLRFGAEKQTQYDDDLKECDCIPVTASGEDLVKPGELVHPGKPIGCLFDKDDGRFPFGDEYLREERLLSLEQLGMATEDLSWKDICDVAEKLQDKHLYLAKEDMLKKTVVLLQCMDSKLQKKDEPSDDLKTRLLHAPFLPVLSKPADYPLDWYPCKSTHLPASELFKAKDAFIIGSVQPVFDEDCLGKDVLTDRILTFLGIQQKSVQVEDVIKQLHLVIDIPPGKVGQETRDICKCIYSFLYTVLNTTNETSYDNAEEFLEELKALPFVLVGQRFLKCDQVALRHEHRSGDYLFTLPLELYPFTELFQACGVRDSFGVNDFIKVLRLLKEEHQDSQLTLNEIAVVKDMLSALVEEPSIDDYRSQLWIPERNGVLKQISEVTYNDIPWEQEDKDLTYTHESITRHEVEKLRIKTCRQLKLENCSTHTGFQSPFGQSEQLTNRLKGILGQYDHIPDVFKELLQNADDARATEIHFVLDLQERYSARLVGDSWKDIHALPALCVYNNSVFSPADLEGIQKVGVGGKLTDATTSGTFGIGFNATYHLTDCPTFVTNNQHLCIFDPQIKYVPGSSREHPGMLYTVGGADGCNAKFPDMMSGYLGDKFQLEGATMFRFPLRSNNMAMSSEISRKSYTDRKAEKLLEEFENVAAESLLFLNHVKKISFSKIDRTTGECFPGYTIEASIDAEGKATRKELAEHLQAHRNKRVTEVPPLHRVYEMEIKDNHGKRENWLVAQTIGLHNSSNFNEDNQMTAKTYLPRGGAAALMQVQKPAQHPATIQSHIPSNSSGRQYRAFCFLPLQIKTGLPVHVNGCFLLDNSRRNLVKGEEYGEENSGGFIHKWNRLLIMHVIAPAYAFLIERAGKILLDPEVDDFPDKCKSSHDAYDELFPMNIHSSEKEWPLLARECLNYIAKNNMEVLPVVKGSDGDQMTVEWYHPTSASSRAFFDNLPGPTTSYGVCHTSLQQDSTSLQAFLLATGFRLLSSSTRVCYAFLNADVEAAFVSSQAVLQHLGRLAGSSTFPIPCLVEETAFRDPNTCRTVLKYCLQDTESIDELKGIPLCLTNDCSLTVFTSTTGAYLTKHLDVLPDLPYMFIHKDLDKVLQHWIEVKQRDQSVQDKDAHEEFRDKVFKSGLLKQFTMYELATHIGTHLPQAWKGINQHVHWTPGKDGHPEEQWIRCLWHYILSIEGDDGLAKCMDILRDWPIIPTHQGTLVPPCLANTLLYLDNFGDTSNRKRVVDVLRKAKCPEVDTKHMKNQTPTFGTPKDPLTRLKNLLDSHLIVPTSQAKVLCVFHYMEPNPIQGNLSEDDAVILLKYFQEGCTTFSTEEIQMLKRLPIFLTSDEKLVSISNYDYCHIGEPKMPNVPCCQQSVWMAAAKCLFLKGHMELQLLYETLGITQIGRGEIYLQYILPNFQDLNIDSKQNYIIHIRDSVLKYTSDDLKKRLLGALRTTAFIQDDQGNLQCTNYFFDPKNPVFNAMKDSDRLQQRLLPPRFSEDWKWQQFLSKLCLQTKVTQELFVEFAHEIEQATSVGLMTDEEVAILATRSKVLCEELNLDDGLNDDLKHEYFLARIAHIKFIPSVPVGEELQQIHPQPADTTRFIAYHGSMSECNKNLVWSVAKLLPQWAIPRFEFEIRDKNLKQLRKRKINPRECLGIGMSATLGKVISHTQNICDKMAERNRITQEDTVLLNVRQKFQSVIEKLYIFLHKNLEEGRQKIKQRLKNSPICLVDGGHVLVRASQMVEKVDDHVKQNLEPYIYETPLEFGKFHSLFTLLGATKRVTFDQLAYVLHDIRQECIDNAMSPPERKTAHAAVLLLFKLLQHTPAPVQHSVQELYLPTPDNFLMLSTDLHYANTDDIGTMELTSTDIKFIVPLKQCGLEYGENETKLIELLPEELRLQDLKSKMCEKPLETNQECEAEDHCRYLQHVKRLITSAEMQRVLQRVVQHHNKGSPLNDGQRQQILRLQQNLSFKCFSQLQSGFFDATGKKIMVRRTPRPAFFIEEPNRVWLYLEHRDPNHLVPQILQKIADIVNKCCKQILHSEHILELEAVLACPTVDGMNQILTDSYAIPEYDDITCGAIQPDKERPGLVVSTDIRHLLDDDMNNLFRPGEPAVYKRPLEDSGGIEPLGAAVAAVGGQLEDGDYELIHVEILERLSLESPDGNAAHNLRRKYKIDIGTDEPIIVSVAMLYKFRRPDCPGLPERFAVVPAVEIPERVHLPDAEGAFNNDLQEAQNSIRIAVQVAASSPEREQREIVRRLYRQWHPDRNLEQQQLANAAFQFLGAEIQRTGVTRSYARQYHTWNDDINREREEQRRYQEQYSRRRNRSAQNQSESFVPPTFNQERPDLRNGRLWYKQAEEDLQAIDGQRVPHPAWAAFMIQQVVEKALKAARYSQNGRPNSRTHDLQVLVRDVCGHSTIAQDTADKLVRSVSRIIRMKCDFERSRYPDSNTSQTSQQLYADFQVPNAIAEAKKILDIVRGIIGIHVY